MRARELLPLLCLPLLGSCAGSELAASDARAAFEAIAAVTGMAGSEAQAIAEEHPGTTAAVAHTLACPDGGTVRLLGVSATCADVASQGELTLTLELDRCTVGDVTLGGSFEHLAERELVADGSFLAYRVRGELSVDGAVDGTCEFDVRYSNVLHDGKLDFSGSLCGHDAAALDLAVGILPPWNCERP